MLVHDALDGRAGKRRLSGEHLVQHTTQRVDIAAPVEILATRCLLRTHVKRRPNRQPRLGELLAAGRIDRPRDAEIGNDRVAVLDEDVLRFDVAVDDIAFVRRVERVGHFARELHGIVNRQLLLAIQEIAQRLALHVGHHIIKETVLLPRIEQRQDVRVVELCGNRDFAEEAFGADRGGEFGAQDFHRYLAVVLEVLGEVDCSHASGAQLFLDGVAIGKGGFEAVKGVGHEGLR